MAILRDLPESRNLRLEGNQVAVELSADDRRLAALLERLLAAGVRVTSFAEEEPTLEDVFMTLTESETGQ